MRRLLILGGTGEARALAALAAERFGARLEIVVSLAGRTRAPEACAGMLRVGGFGGVAGLAAYLREAKIDLVVDASHPFAATIAAHAADAARQAAVPLLRLERPAWVPADGDRWIAVPDAPSAARAAAERGTRIFLSFGGREVAAFAGLEAWFLVRRIEPPEQALPLARYALALGRGPFSVAGECALLKEHRINVVVTKASGGDQTRAKIDAARELGLPVIMIARPSKPSADTVAEPQDAVRRIAGTLFPDTGIDGPAAVSA